MTGVPDNPIASLDQLQASTAALEEEAARLEASVRCELAAGPTAPWSAALEALAADVLPLSLTDGRITPFERRMAALRRQRVRLPRDGEALRERAHALREQIALVREHSATAADLAARVRAWSGEAKRYHTSTTRWTEELLEHRRRYEALGDGRGGSADK